MSSQFFKLKKCLVISTCSSGRSRRGELFPLAEIVSFLVFCIAAFMFYLLLFKPASDTHIAHIEHFENLSSDAHYIATVLPRLQAIDSHGIVHGTFGDAIRSLAHAHATMSSSDFTIAIKDSLYASSLESIITDQFFARELSDHHSLLRVGVVMRSKDAYWSDTWYEKRSPKDKSVAIRSILLSFGLHAEKNDPETGLIVPDLDGIEVGTSYVPSVDGPIYLQVFLTRDTE